MTQEEKQLLLKDLCARLPYEVILLAPNGRTIYQTDGNTGAELFVEEGWKPYLRPMDSMTEEECKKLGDLPATIENVGETLPNVPYYMEVARPEQLDWLNSHHFDYRGLIPMGLALEAPADMYKEVVL